MVKKIKKEISEFPYSKVWMWSKRIIWSILVLAIVYGVGTFYPNPIAKKWANEEIRQEHTKWAQNLGLVSKEMRYKNKKEFIKELGYCVDYINFTTPVDKRVPIEMLVGQAVLESGWGKSRFANEGNNLFGIRTWDQDEPYLLPIPWTKWPGWGVKMYSSKCESVIDYLHILNNVSAFKELRAARDSGIDDALILADYLSKYASKPTYTELVKEIIKYNLRGVYEL